MVRFSDIRPLTDFLRNSKDHIGALKASGNAEVLTVNGEAAVVVQDAKSYETLYELAEQARQDERLRQAIEAVKAGDPTEPLDQVFSRLRKKHELTQ